MAESQVRDPKFFTHDLGILTRRLADMRTKGRLTQNAKSEYRTLVKDYFAYVEHAIQHSSKIEVHGIDHF